MMMNRFKVHTPDPFCHEIKDYNETTDPFNRTQLNCAVVPGYPFLCRMPVDERFRKHSYDQVELPIYGHNGSYEDFPLDISVSFFNKEWERQHVVFTKSHTFLALYNHSHFVRKHGCCTKANVNYC